MALPLNNSWRSPSIQVLANGSAISGAIEAEVFSNNNFTADRFSARIAIGADLAHNLTFWANAQGLQVDIRFSLDGAHFQSLIQGLVDSVTVEPMAASVRIEGRDLTAALIESRSQESFSNRTSSEIAALIAERHGLTPIVTPTTTPVGRYYQDEHDRITLGLFSRAITEWDQLVFLARQEGFDVFVQGTALFFQPPQPSDVHMLRPTDLTDLRLRRSLTLARDIEVTVKSWNSREKNAFVQTARSTTRRSGSGGGGFGGQRPQRYTFVRANLTPEQALQLAQRKLSELTRHEKIIEATLPGELSLGPRSQVALSGTGTDFDQTYFLDVIERSLSAHRGFVQRLRAKNTSPRSEATIPAEDVGNGGLSGSIS